MLQYKYILCKKQTKKHTNKEMEEEKLNVKQHTPAGQETSRDYIAESIFSLLCFNIQTLT